VSVTLGARVEQIGQITLTADENASSSNPRADEEAGRAV
jgi:hypothetical protein